MTKQTLQSLFDTCNWQGYAIYKGKKVFLHEINQIAKEKNIKLEYNCPA